MVRGKCERREEGVGGQFSLLFGDVRPVWT